MLPQDLSTLVAVQQQYVRFKMKYVITGNGPGKSTSALGICLRAIGHGKRAIVIQFLKGRKTGEIKAAKTIPNLEIYQFGLKKLIDLKNPPARAIELVRKGLKFAEQIAKSKPFLIVLDEINVAAGYGLVDPKDVLSLIGKFPRIHWILTGRAAPKEFIKLADIVSDIREVKYPKPPKAIRGLQY